MGLQAAAEASSPSRATMIDNRVPAVKLNKTQIASPQGIWSSYSISHSLPEQATAWSTEVVSSSSFNCV